jgi:hypothetical protein
VLSATVLSFVLLSERIPRTDPSVSRRLPSALTTSAARNAAQRLANLGWAFEPNRGQSAPQVKFLTRANGATVFLTDDSVYVSWGRRNARNGQSATAHSDFVRLEFAGAGHSGKAAGDSLLPGKTNYLIGRDPSRWHTDVPHYAAVRYAGLYPGVDARFYGGVQGLEYDLTASPGTDLRQLLLRVKGADSFHLDAHGNLVIGAGVHQLTMKRPQIYQLENKTRTDVASGYRLLNGNEIGFEVGKHRADLPLVIDPIISVAYTTFLGGNGAEQGNSVAVDSAGKIYVGGTTTLPTFPEAATFTDGPANGTSTLFVAKIDPSQSGSASLTYLAFIGGSGNDQGGLVALDNSPLSATPPGTPNLAILGWTTSMNFPVTMGSVPTGTPNLTVSDLNSAGNGFIYSEYFGGSGAEATQGTGAIVTSSTGGGIATDSLGDVFVTSDTTSANLTTTGTAIVPTFTGPSDGMLAEFASGTGTLLYCSYLGLNATTVGSSGIAVDSSGNAYVDGFTSTTTTTFTNTFQGTYPGGSLDAFVMEVNLNPVPPASGLVYGGFIGGTQTDQATSVTVDNATPANAYVAGLTQSSNLIPSTGVTNAPFQPSLGSGATQNGFFAVINQSASPPVLQYITYLGGSGTDTAESVAVVPPSTPGPSTQVYVAGSTTSTNFPSLCTLQGFSGAQDQFVAEFNPTTSGAASLLDSTFLGGSDTAQANSVAAGPAGNAIIFGETISPDYPLAGNPQTGFQLTCTSCAASTPLSDAVLTKVTVNSTPVGCAAFSPTPAVFGSFADGTTSPAVNVQLTNDGSASLSITSVTVVGANSGDFAVPIDTCLTSSPIAEGSKCGLSITFTPSILGPETAQLQVTDDGVASPQTLTLTGTGTGVGITLSGTSLTFPNTSQGQVSAAQTITLTNNSADNLSVTQSSIAGTNPTDFEFGSSNNCTGTIAPSGTCTIAIQFAPNESNPPSTGLALSAQYNLSLMDQTNQSTQTVTIPLAGTEFPALPGVVFSPTSLTFSSENVGGSTAPLPITVTNNGSAALNVTSVSITGANPGDFSQTNTCIASSPLAPNANCTISVTFQPTAAGPRSASVSVSDNVTGSPQTVPISGTGTAAGVTLTPSSLTFLGQNPGTPPSSPQTVTLQNIGTGPLTISSIAITGTNVGDFAQTNNCPIGPSATLNAGQACAIAVTFAPTGTGARSASLSVSDNANPSPQSVSLSGTGTIPGAQFNLSTIPFGSVLVGAQSSSEPVQINNTGNGPLVITHVGFTGTDPNDFQAAGSCVGASGSSVSVPAASNCTVNVTFAPTASGSRGASLSVTDNAPGSPQQLPVTGTATDFQLGAGSGGSTSVTITAGETATFNLQVTPVNGFTGTLAMSSANPIPNATATISPTQIPISGSQPVGFAVAVETQAASGIAPRKWFFIFPRHTNWPIAFGFLLLALAFVAVSNRKRHGRRLFRPAFLLAGVLLVSSCGGGNSSNSNGTPAGTYTVTVTGTVSGVARTLNLTVIVQ